MKAIVIGVCICLLGCEAPSSNDNQGNENRDVESSTNLRQGKDVSREDNSIRNSSIASDSIACTEFLNQFYTSYLGACLDDLEEEAALKDSLIKAHCTKRFIEYSQTIDWDAILSAQDCTNYSATHFTVNVVDSNTGIYIVDYVFYGGDPTNAEELDDSDVQIEVIIQLVEVSGKLKINQAVSSVDELK